MTNISNYYPEFMDLLGAHLGQIDRSQSWLAERLGVSPSTVSRWLEGISRPRSPEQIIRIADLLGIDRNKLLASAGYAYIEQEGGQTEESVGQGKVTNWPLNLPWNDPYYSLPERDKSLDDVTKKLNSRIDTQWGVFISGLGGLGKTASAIEIARRCLNAGAFDRVLGDSAKLEFLIDGRISRLEDKARLSYERFLNELAIQLGKLEIQTKSLSEKQRIVQELLNTDRYLVIIDNLETADDANQIVREFPPLLGKSRAIITSREIVARSKMPISANLEDLEESDAIKFLRQDAEVMQCEGIKRAKDVQLREIFDCIGRQPLALKLIVGQISNFGLDETLNNIKSREDKVHGISDLYRFIYWDSWQSLSSTAQRILIHIGIQSAPVSFRILKHAFRTENDELMSAIAQLIARSLIISTNLKGEHRYGIHDLTRQFIHSDLPVLYESST